MARQQVVYADFSGGMNDSSASISISDKEVCLSKNADYSADIMAFRTRKGCSLFNSTYAAGQLREVAHQFTVTFVDPQDLTDDKYVFTYDGTNWELNERTVTLADYGLTVSGSPLSGDAIYLVKGTTTYTATVRYNPLDISYIYMWSSGPAYKKCVVIDAKLYEMTAGGTLTKKIDLTANTKKIYPFVFQNNLYFGDGSELYSWGVPDYITSGSSSIAQPITLAVGDVVKNTKSTAGGSVVGKFYKSLQARSIANANAEDYTVAANWQDVTDVPFFSSTIVKAVVAPGKGEKEKVKLTVLNGNPSGADATISIVLGSGTTATSTISINATVLAAHTSVADTVADIKTAIEGYSGIGQMWSITSDTNSITLTSAVEAQYANGYIDMKDSGISMTYLTLNNGKADDNNLAPIKKCTMFFTHTASYRVFACGNPDDNALYYSEIGEPSYFASDVNKVYAQNGYGKPTGLFQLAESILISYENGWYAWNGITPLEDATWKPLNLPYGCVCNDSIVITPYSFMYLGNDGIYNVSTNVLSDVGTLIYSKNIIKKITSNRIDNIIKSIADKGKCVGIFFNNVYYLAYNTESGEPNDRVVKYEWDTESFTEVTGWTVNAWATDNKSLFFASTNYVVEAANEDSEHDYDMVTGEEKAIELHIKTKAYHFGNPFVDKVVNLLGLIFKQTDVIDDIFAKVKIIMGYESCEIDTIRVTESLIYGRTWGHIWGFRDDICKMIELTKSSNTFQIEITNSSIDSPITLLAIGFVYEVTDYVTPNMLKDEVLLQ